MTMKRLSYRTLKEDNLNRGLTLIELMLAIAIFSTIATMLYSVLFQGIKLWKKDTILKTENVEKRIVIEKFASDLRQSFIHQWVNFVGEADQIYFCGIEDGHLRKIRYLVNRSKRHSKLYLIRSQYKIYEDFEEKPDTSRPFSDVFEELSFQYGYWDPEEEQIVQHDHWEDNEALPKIVTLHYKINQESFQYTIIHPLGTLPEAGEYESETQ